MFHVKRDSSNGGRLRGIAIWSGSVILVFVLVAAGYCSWVVLEARDHTRTQVHALLASPRLTLDPAAMPASWLKALLMVQDPGFFQHNGWDLSTPGAGLTTITQALVKILYFDQFRPGFAKIKQTLIAVFALDPLVSKKGQLKLFVNLIGLGEGTRGFDQAARHYFHKSFGQLSEDEFLSLLAMIIAPQTFNLRTQPQRNQERVRRIKLLISGAYRPKGLMDQFYGKLDPEAQKQVAPFSYFESLYD